MKNELKRKMLEFARDLLVGRNITVETYKYHECNEYRYKGGKCTGFIVDENHFHIESEETLADSFFNLDDIETLRLEYNGDRKFCVVVNTSDAAEYTISAEE